MTLLACFGATALVAFVALLVVNLATMRMVLQLALQRIDAGQPQRARALLQVALKDWTAVTELVERWRKEDGRG